jgi:hypothetical protein
MGDEFQYKGNTNTPVLVESEPQQLPELKPKERAAIKAEREKFFQLVPEFYEFFRAAHELGMHDGWRSIRVTPIPKNTSDD